MILFLKNWAPLIVSFLSLVVAIMSLIKSNKAQDLQMRIHQIEIKIKENELEKINEEQIAKEQTNVEANIIHIATHKYRVRACNLSSKSVYNVNVVIDKKYNIVMINDIMPYEVLEVGKSFDIPIVVHTMSSTKFEIITEWENDRGNRLSNKQLRDLN